MVYIFIYRFIVVIMSTNIYFIILTVLIHFSCSREHLYDTSDKYLLQEKTERTTTDGDFVNIESNTLYINYQDNETSTDNKNLIELEHVIDPPRISSQMSPDIETVVLSLMDDEDQQRIVSTQRYSSITADAANEDLGVEPREIEPREVGYSTSNLAKGSPLRALVANRKINKVNLNKNDILKLKQKYYSKPSVTEKYPATEDQNNQKILLNSLNDIKQLVENSTSKCHVQSLNAQYKNYKEIINLKIKYIRSDLNNFIKNNENQDALMMGNIESFRLVLNNQETRFKNYEVNFDKIKQQCNQNCQPPGTFNLKQTYNHKVSLPHPIASFYAGYSNQQNFRASDAGNSTDSAFQRKTVLDMKKINENISYLRDTVDNFRYNFEQFSSDHTSSTLEQNNLKTDCKCNLFMNINTKLDIVEEKLEKQIENTQNDMEQRILKLEGKFHTKNILEGAEDNAEHAVTSSTVTFESASNSAAKDQELSARVTELERKFADMESLKETVALLSQQVRVAANKTGRIFYSNNCVKGLLFWKSNFTNE